MLIDGQRHITGPQTGQLGYPQSGTNREMQHRPVSDTIAGRWIRGIQQRLNFLADEIGHQARTGFLERYRQNTTDLFERRRLPVLKEVKERFYRRQPDVACLWRVPACVLQMFEECADQFRIKLLQRERRRFRPKFGRRELEQKLEAVSIRIACVLAGASVTREIITQEGFDMGGDRRHGCAPPDMKRSPAPAMSLRRSAVASRYQYVA